MNSGVFWISYGLLWGCVVVLLALMLLIYRQVGLVYLGSRHAVEHGGIPLGATVPDIEVTRLVDDRPTRLSEVLATPNGPTLALFSLPVCPLCHGIAVDLPPLLAAWSERVKLVWLERSGLEKIPDRFGDTPGVEVVIADQKGYAAFDIRGAPYVYLINERGAVVERGLVNSAEDLERLIENRVPAEEETSGTSQARLERPTALIEQ